jgi:hypothetical protein
MAMQRTTSPQFVYPVGALPITLDPPGFPSPAMTYSAWVEVIASTPEAWAISGITVGRQAGGLGNSNAEFDVQLAVADEGDEDDHVIATIRVGEIHNEISGRDPAINGGRMPLPFPLDVVPDGSRIAARARTNDNNNPGDVYLTLNYYRSPLEGSGDVSTSPPQVLPANLGVTLTAHADPWTYGDPEVVGTLASEVIIIDWSTAEATTGTAIDVELALDGDPFATLPIRQGSYFTVGHRTHIPIPFRVAAGEITAKMRTGAGGGSMRFSLGYQEWPA